MTDTNQYLYQLHLTQPEILTEGPTGEQAEILGAHFEYLTDLAEQGIVLLAGRNYDADRIRKTSRQVRR